MKKIIEHILRENLRLNVSDEKIEALDQFIKFGIVGLSNTAIAYAIYVGTLFFLQRIKMFPAMDYLISQVIAFMVSVLWSFYWNNKYVFKKEDSEERNLFQSLIKVYISYAFTGLFLNSILSILWVEIVHAPKIIAPIINLVVSVPINYLMNKCWAFERN